MNIDLSIAVILVSLPSLYLVYLPRYDLFIAFVTTVYMQSRAGTGSRVTGSPGHRVSDFVRVGSGLGSKLFTFRPGILTRFLTEQQNDTAAVSMLGTHE